jgi:hypothetical protein
VGRVGLEPTTGRLNYGRGYHGVVPPMALTALVAPIARSTNRSTPTMAATGCQLQNVTAFRPISTCPRPVA